MYNFSGKPSKQSHCQWYLYQMYTCIQKCHTPVYSQWANIFNKCIIKGENLCVKHKYVHQATARNLVYFEWCGGCDDCPCQSIGAFHNISPSFVKIHDINSDRFSRTFPNFPVFFIISLSCPMELIHGRLTFELICQFPRSLVNIHGLICQGVSLDF